MPLGVIGTPFVVTICSDVWGVSGAISISINKWYKYKYYNTLSIDKIVLINSILIILHILIVLLNVIIIRFYMLYYIS